MTHEIASDESGYEGERLIGGETTLFAHGSVNIASADADALVAELRQRIGSPATEYKANHLQRRKHRAVLEWLLSPAAPLLGNAHVYLVDKATLVIRALLDTLLGGTGIGTDTHTDIGTDNHTEIGIGIGTNDATTRLARTVDRTGADLFGNTRWREFLATGNNLLRTNIRVDPVAAADEFYRQVAALRSDLTDGAGDPTGTDPWGENGGVLFRALDGFTGSRDRLATFRRRVADDPHLLPPLDPLLIGIIGTVRSWAGPDGPVTLIHDRQNMLSAQRIDQLTRLLNGPDERTPDRLAGLRIVPSQTDARIQLADIVAGTVRGIIEGGPRPGSDAALKELARPYLDRDSLWGDQQAAPA